MCEVWAKSVRCAIDSPAWLSCGLPHNFGNVLFEHDIRMIVSKTNCILVSLLRTNGHLKNKTKITKKFIFRHLPRNSYLARHLLIESLWTKTLEAILFIQLRGLFYLIPFLAHTVIVNDTVDYNSQYCRSSSEGVVGCGVVGCGVVGCGVVGCAVVGCTVVGASVGGETVDINRKNICWLTIRFIENKEIA